jgi:hypothetical protein
MEYNDFGNHMESFEEQKEQLRIMKEAKAMDKGHNVIYRSIPNKNGQMKMLPVNVYTSGGTGSQIRDAETGEYYSNMVGNADEDLFFKVVLATGECKSKNGSTTLFYLSPRHYMSHQNCQVSEEDVQRWQEKRDARYKSKSSMKTKNMLVIVN